MKPTAPKPTNPSTGSKSMRAILTIIGLLLSSLVCAKDVPLTPAWSGLWADQTGQHRCYISVQTASDPTRLILSCQLGRDGVYADVSPAPEPGFEIPLMQQVAPFGAPAAGVTQWGRIAVFGICPSDRRPFVYAGVLGPALSSATVQLYPVTLAVSPASLCAPRIGGAP